MDYGYEKKQEKILPLIRLFDNVDLLLLSEAFSPMYRNGAKF